MKRGKQKPYLAESVKTSPREDGVLTLITVLNNRREFG
jgi:hypothetical protein